MGISRFASGTPGTAFDTVIADAIEVRVDSGGFGECLGIDSSLSPSG
jgi:hypothetical protein